MKVKIEKTKTGYTAYYKLPKHLRPTSAKVLVTCTDKTLPKLFKKLAAATELALVP